MENTDMTEHKSQVDEVPCDDDWKKVAREYQSDFAINFENVLVDSIPFDKDLCLRQKIGYAMFGPPEEEPSKSNEFVGYKLIFRDKIRIVFDQIKNKCESAKLPSFMFSTILVYWKGKIDSNCIKGNKDSKEKSTYKLVPKPIFKIPKIYDPEYWKKHDKILEWYFIDENGRVYKSWQDYLRSNELPRGDYCYPINGEYILKDEEVCLEFKQTPSSSILKKALLGTDIGFGVAGITCGIFGVVGLAAPIVAPVALATAVYSVGRGVSDLVDKATHKESISLKDSRARSSWISIFGSAIGGASGIATRQLSTAAASGKVIGTFGKTAVNTLNFSSIAFNGIGIVSSGRQVFVKYKNKELTPLDIFQFSVSVLFFYNSLVNVKTAESIMRDTQSKVLRDYEASLRSNRHRKAFNKIVKNTTSGDTSVESNAKVIRCLNSIDNKDEYFAALVRLRKNFAKLDAKPTLAEGGRIQINNLKVEPMTFYELSNDDKVVLLSSVNNFAEGNISLDIHTNRVNKILSNYGTKTCNGIQKVPVILANDTQYVWEEAFRKLGKLARTVTIIDKLFIYSLSEYFFDKLNVGVRMRKKVRLVTFGFICICELVVELENVYDDIKKAITNLDWGNASELTSILKYIWIHKDSFQSICTKIQNYVKDYNDDMLVLDEVEKLGNLADNIHDSDVEVIRELVAELLNIVNLCESDKVNSSVVKACVNYVLDEVREMENVYHKCKEESAGMMKEINFDIWYGISGSRLTFYLKTLSDTKRGFRNDKESILKIIEAAKLLE